MCAIQEADLLLFNQLGWVRDIPVSLNEERNRGNEDTHQFDNVEFQSRWLDEQV